MRNPYILGALTLLTGCLAGFSSSPTQPFSLAHVATAALAGMLLRSIWLAETEEAGR